MKRLSLLSGLACVLAAAPAVAQDDAAPAPAGSTAVSLEAGSGYVVGLWRQTSPRVRAGIELGTTLSRAQGDDNEEDFTSFVVRPGVKLFSAGEGAVRPFTLLGAYAEGYRRRSVAEGEFSSDQVFQATEVGARVGAGVEWMPVSRLAIGGHAGVRGGYLRETTRSGSVDRELDGWSAGTFTSGLSLTLFF